MDTLESEFEVQTYKVISSVSEAMGGQTPLEENEKRTNSEQFSEQTEKVVQDDKGERLNPDLFCGDNECNSKWKEKDSEDEARDRRKEYAKTDVHTHMDRGTKTHSADVTEDVVSDDRGRTISSGKKQVLLRLARIGHPGNYTDPVSKQGNNVTNAHRDKRNLPSVLKTSMSSHSAGRYVVKYGEDAIMNRPTTADSKRERTRMMKPDMETLENKKYNLKLQRFIRDQSQSDQSISNNGEAGADDENQNSIDIKTGDEENDINDAFKYSRSETWNESDTLNFYLDNHATADDKHGRVTRCSNASDVTQETLGQSISDSDECDTDLETDFKEGNILFPSCKNTLFFFKSFITYHRKNPYRNNVTCISTCISKWHK